MCSSDLKVFPLHLRGTGGSFATNVGGRMVGTSMAFVTTNWLAPLLAGSGPTLPAHVAQAAGIVATVIDLQFMTQLKARYQGDTLAAAVALFYGGTNGVLFLLQIAAVPRILVTRSLTTTAAIHPIVAIAWYAVFAAIPEIGRAHV